MAHDVFISYSSKNKITADAICHALEQNEIKCWIAPRDISGGLQYGDIIEDAIKTCKVFVIVFSEDSKTSQWVGSELNIAFADNKIIIPFKIDTSKLEGGMRLILNSKHWIEAYPNPEMKFKDLVESVLRLIKDKDYKIDQLKASLNDSFTEDIGFLIDERDGQKYNWRRIGSQVWMTENLAYKAIDGCWAYNDNFKNVVPHGYLYNWKTANRVCPKGWHLPSEEEWNVLENYLIKNCYNYDKSLFGNKIAKSLASEKYWRNCETIGSPGFDFKTNNLSEFNALPSGYLSRPSFWGLFPQEIFFSLGYNAYWWTSTLTNYYAHAKVYGLRNDLCSLEKFEIDRADGLSIRCIKDLR